MLHIFDIFFKDKPRIRTQRSMSTESQQSFNMDLDKNLDPEYEGSLFFNVPTKIKVHVIVNLIFHSKKINTYFYLKIRIFSNFTSNLFCIFSSNINMINKHTSLA